MGGRAPCRARAGGRLSSSYFGGPGAGPGTRATVPHHSAAMVLGVGRSGGSMSAGANGTPPVPRRQRIIVRTTGWRATVGLDVPQAYAGAHNGKNAGRGERPGSSGSTAACRYGSSRTRGQTCGSASGAAAGRGHAAGVQMGGVAQCAHCLRDLLRFPMSALRDGVPGDPPVVAGPICADG